MYNTLQTGSLSEFIIHVSLKRDENPKFLIDLPPELAHLTAHFTD